MICVTVLVDSKQNYTGIEILGHAGCAENRAEEQELVCAAVSALTLNMANSIEQFTKDAFDANMNEESGLFKFCFANGISSESKLLMNSLVFGLEDIEETYGEPYIKIRFEEV